MMNPKWKKNLIALLLFCAVMSFVVIKTINYRNLRNTGTKVEGVAYIGTLYVTWKYRAQGREYDLKVSKSDYPFIVDGEQYYVYYDPDDPSTSLMSFTEPIMKPSEYDTIRSLPITATYASGSELVSFLYLYDGDTLKREHRYLFKNSFNSSGQTFTVYLKLDNPRISYIDFEND